jgi:hypothetical protein
VLPAVYFDDDARGVTDEISNERSDRHLSTELEVRKASISQRKP